MMAVVQTARRERKWYVHLFESANGPYLFVKHLGEGAESHAQCVRQLETNQLQVRKVRLHRLDARQVRDTDNEIRITQFLKTLLVPYGNYPRYAQLLSHQDEPMLTGNSKTNQKWSRVSYWRYYNGGDLSRFKQSWMSERIEIPLPIIARFIGQVCHTLWLFQSGPVSVFHRDLNMSNIFLHWQAGSPLPDFHVGDFGKSGLSTEVDTDYLSLDNYRQRDVSHVSAHAKALLYRVINGKIDVFGDIRKVISKSGPLRAVFEELDAFVTGSQTNGNGVAPSLERVTQLAEYAESELLKSCSINTRAFFDDKLVKMQNAMPRYFDGKHKALSSYPIPGPWRLAQVNPVTGAVLAIDKEMHHRPNQHNDDSDTDNEFNLRLHRKNSRVFVEGSSGDGSSSKESFVQVEKP